MIIEQPAINAILKAMVTSRLARRGVSRTDQISDFELRLMAEKAFDELVVAGWKTR
jgi:hypothetical protein